MESINTDDSTFLRFPITICSGKGIVSIIEPLLPFVVACLLLGSLLLTLYFMSVKIIEGKLPNSLKLSLLPRHLVTGLAVGFGFFKR